jgi:two-component system nitrate/nitrite sensor histidine kinase NarX
MSVHLAARVPPSLLLRLGVLMLILLVLAVLGMSSSVIIADTTQGVATAVNQAGSLRMQSFRIATGLASRGLPAGTGYPHPAADLIAEFEARFTSPRLTDAIPSGPDHPLHQAYRQVAGHWQRLVGPVARQQADDGQPGTGPGTGYLQLVDAFVADIDALVRLLEEYAEGKIAFLRLIQASGLLLTALVVVVSLALIQERLLVPLRDLLHCAERARRGDFSVRTRHLADDELGRLGHAFNVMAADLSKIYADLERRVREKTEDLAHRNRSLDLLYATSRQVHNVPLGSTALEGVIRDIQTRLGLGPGTICLRSDQADGPGHWFATTRDDGAAQCCWGDGCRACRATHSGFAELTDPAAGRRRSACFPIRERDRHFGVLMVDLPDRAAPEPWEMQVLETVAGHIGAALANQQRTQEDRRLALYEERGVIARELHDSLAQSLSYLKIQISRLDAALAGSPDLAGAREVSAELRDGVTSAYRQLRELLTTFRLKMDGRGLSKALVDTVQEFRRRSTLNILLDNHLPPACLSPNAEIHVLQIVREALSNVTRHAQARHARVALCRDGPRVEVLVEDDGRGLAGSPPGLRHYGMTIMRERSQSLQGELQVQTRPEGGTRVHLCFHLQPPATPAEPAHAA